MSSNKDTVTSSSSATRLTGRVKWFNNKAGYGFITITDGANSGSEIFVHHSAVNVENQQYKYLVQGEYVEFDLVSVQSEKHDCQASNVSGIRGGKLMCETRHELKTSRTEYKSTKTSEDTVVRAPRQRQPREPRQNKEGRKQRTNVNQNEGDKKEWTLVKRKTTNTNAPRRQPRTTKNESS